jgi:benzylsuccinate CoA-transferase BbsF subunit
MSGALADLRVVELGAFAAGPAVGKHLADHGAEVIRIESRSRPDGFRANYPPYKDGVPGPERAGMFAMTNNDKLGVTLNLKTEAGLGLARRLISRADVVVENFTPGTMDRLGLGYDALKEENPSLVMLSTCNQGQTGPNAQRAGFGTHLTAQSGFIHLTGWPDRAPSLLWGPYIDYIAVAYGFVAVLAALDERRRSGRGAHIDLSQYETGLQFASPVLLQHSAGGPSAERDGNRHPGAAPHGIYRCAGEERWVALSVHDDAEWERLRGALGDPAWARRPELATAAGRKLLEAELDAALGEWTRARSREEVVAALRAAGVHAAAVNDMADIHSDPDLASHQVFRPLRHEVLGEFFAVGPPFLLSETPARLERPPFRLGEHNRHVFRELLGLGEAEYESCEAAGAFD